MRRFSRMIAEMSVKLRVIVKRAARSEERVVVKSGEKEREREAVWRRVGGIDTLLDVVQSSRCGFDSLLGLVSAICLVGCVVVVVVT